MKRLCTRAPKAVVSTANGLALSISVMASKPSPAPGYVPLLFKPGDGRQLAPSPPCFLGHILCSAPARALSCGFERLKDRGRIAASMSTGDDRGEELGALRDDG